jgi:hypothetical protein
MLILIIVAVISGSIVGRLSRLALHGDPSKPSGRS